jgi:hypothetical protein
VLEEQAIRTQGKGGASLRFREQLEELPFLKKLRSAGTSLGSLQACVALGKLRPGGMLIWAREEPLGSKEGSEVLNFLLDRSRLIYEWDYSQLEHSLPLAAPLYPKYLYLFQRETQLEARLAHRPIRQTIQGQVRSHIEVPIVLEDSFETAAHSLHSNSPSPVQPRGQWNFLSHHSPTSQKDWVDKWPDPTSSDQVRQLDQLRAISLPLAHFTTIRLTPEGDPERNGAWTVHFSQQECKKGFWISAEYGSDGRKLVVKSLPGPGQEAFGHGFLVLVSDESWACPLSTFLQSAWIQRWLDYHSERRGERWILNEQVVKWIPVPQPLLNVLGIHPPGEEPSRLFHGKLLPERWESLASQVGSNPRHVLANLDQTPCDPNDLPYLHSIIFTRAAQALDDLYQNQKRIFSLVSEDGRILWRELLTVFPTGECIAISIHPKIRLTGSLPAHLPIGKIDRVKSPTPGILLTTESGFSLHIGSQTQLLIHMIWEQLDGISNPTWNELLQYIKIPRRVELAESTALEVLQSHGEQSARLKDLKELLASCHLF